MTNTAEKANCPYIVFRIASNLYTLNSANVMAIMELPAVESIPDSANGMRGIFIYMGSAVPMLDLRTAFGKKSLNSEYLEFADMLDRRKEDHRRWMVELKRTVDAHEKFGLATDPHKCAFGKWYYGFTSDNNAINHHLEKIEEPHRLLHEAALAAVKCDQQHEKCQRERCLKEVLRDAEHIYAKTVIDLIDEAKEVMRAGYREMTLVIEHRDRYYGLAIDEVLSVEELEENGSGNGMSAVSQSPLVESIKKCARYQNELIIELNEDNLLGHFGF